MTISTHYVVLIEPMTGSIITVLDGPFHKIVDAQASAKQTNKQLPTGLVACAYVASVDTELKPEVVDKLSVAVEPPRSRIPEPSMN